MLYPWMLKHWMCLWRGKCRCRLMNKTRCILNYCPNNSLSQVVARIIPYNHTFHVIVPLSSTQVIWNGNIHRTYRNIVQITLELLLFGQCRTGGCPEVRICPGIRRHIRSAKISFFNRLNCSFFEFRYGHYFDS